VTCVCDPPLCGGADLDADEAGYCKACADLDAEDHCLRCSFECCQYDGDYRG
jgi:hypothetical protein